MTEPEAYQLIGIVMRPWVDTVIRRKGTVSNKEWEAATEKLIQALTREGQ